MMRLATLTLGGLVCLACSGEDGQLEQATLNIEAMDERGRHGQIGCSTLPLLQGGRAYERFVIDDSITIVVRAEPSEVSLSFQEGGLSLAKALTIPRSALVRGYAEEVALRLQNGELYTILLSSECAP
jgi:hypothetical protein